MTFCIQMVYKATINTLIESKFGVLIFGIDIRYIV